MTYYRTKVKISLKRHSAFQTGAKIYLSEKNILGLGALSAVSFGIHMRLHTSQTQNWS